MFTDELYESTRFIINTLVMLRPCIDGLICKLTTYIFNNFKTSYVSLNIDMTVVLFYALYILIYPVILIGLCLPKVAVLHFTFNRYLNIAYCNYTFHEGHY